MRNDEICIKNQNKIKKIKSSVEKKAVVVVFVAIFVGGVFSFVVDLMDRVCSSGYLS